MLNRAGFIELKRTCVKRRIRSRPEKKAGGSHRTSGSCLEKTNLPYVAGGVVFLRLNPLARSLLRM